MEVRYRYNKLDKRHEYQIKNEQNIFSQWVWFYLGKKIREYKNEIILPYIYNPTKTIVEESNRINYHAEQVANIIVKAIKKHRQKRKIIK